MLLNFEISKESDSIEVFLDEEGIDNLMSYLNYVKSSKDHIHLLAHEKGEITKKDFGHDKKIIEYVTLHYLKES